MYLFLKKKEERERGEKKNTAPACVVSVDLTSDLAEYGIEESAESTQCGGESCVLLCACVKVSMCAFGPLFYVGGEGEGGGGV